MLDKPGLEAAITVCNVRKGSEKGRVESGVGYVKKNLLNGWEISDFQVVEPTCRQWLDSIANVRIRGETRKKPIDLFLFAEEKPRLKPLPTNLYDVANISQVRASSQFRVTLDTNRYSVPAEYAGSDITLKSYPDQLCMYYQKELIANRAFKQWPEIFNNDSTLTSAILDRVLHHAETIVVEGKSYRMKDQIEV